jgi:hypothetical protein
MRRMEEAGWTGHVCSHKVCSLDLDLMARQWTGGVSGVSARGKGGACLAVCIATTARCMQTRFGTKEELRHEGNEGHVGCVCRGEQARAATGTSYTVPRGTRHSAELQKWLHGTLTDLASRHAWGSQNPFLVFCGSAVTAEASERTIASSFVGVACDTASCPFTFDVIVCKSLVWQGPSVYQRVAEPASGDPHDAHSRQRGLH